jgi:hypothetical protein
MLLLLFNMYKCLFLWICVGSFLISCKKDSYIGGNVFLIFSSDSVSFDTVFAATGSVTKQVKIINNNDQKLLISDISLVGGKNSAFILNINGSPGPSSSNLTLDADDSIYLFISVYINPENKPQAFILQDSIRILYNGIEQYIRLSAWGQNAHFLSNAVIQGNVNWINDLPYVISGGLQVDSNSTLTIQAGCRIFFHANAPMLVDGTLLVLGEAADSQRVYFNDDRLDEPYASFPGSWPGIYFRQSSTNNVLQYAILRNGDQTIVAEGPSINSSPKLQLNQCIIDNSLETGILGIQSSIDAVNCLISNCGNNIAIALGGTYHFTHCTAASYSNPVLQHQQPVLSVSNAGTVGSQLLISDLQISFTNCIFWGDSAVVDEAQISDQGNTVFQVLFDHDILQQQHYPAHVDSIALLLNIDPEFVKIDNQDRLYDFHLRAGSPALGIGNDQGIGVDLDGNARIPGKQDLGCYERQ